MPYNGYLVDTIYKTGTFKPAFLFKKSIHNERMIYNIQTNLGMIYSDLHIKNFIIIN